MGVQRAEEGIGGALKFAEFATAIFGPKDIGVKGKSTKDVSTRRMEVALKQDMLSRVSFPRTSPLERGEGCRVGSRRCVLYGHQAIEFCL